MTRLYSTRSDRYGDLAGLPVVVDADGRGWLKKDINTRVLQMIVVGDYFRRMVKHMTTDLEPATKALDTATDQFTKAVDRFNEVRNRFVDDGKHASGTIRDAADKLAQGLSRIEKAANFDRLERYVLLLERAATAMTALAELEATGKLEKISAAIR